MKLITKITSMINVLFFSFFLITFSEDDGNPADSTDNNNNNELQGYTLVWSDEFDGDQINLNKWEHEVNGWGGGNNEAQYYTDRSDNSLIENGKLIIIARLEEFTGPDGTRSFTSARLRTMNKGDWKYGRIEVNAKLPSGRGTWPAIWMLPTDWIYGGWPASGEIDIMEHVGYDPGNIHASVHTSAYNSPNGNHKTSIINIPDAETEFHVYAMEWSADKLDMFVDDTKYFTFNNEGTGWQVWPFSEEFHLILNIAVGGNWGAVQGIDDTIFPQRMEVDYVRVYEKDE